MDVFVFTAWVRARLRVDEHGGPLVEYIFLIGALAVIVVLTIKVLGGHLSERTSMMNHQLVCTDKNCNPG